VSPAQGKAALLFGRLPQQPGNDEQDVLVEAATVGGALKDLGYPAVELPLTLDLRKASRRLRRLDPPFVFNLVVSLEGQDRLAHLAPALLDSLGLPYTGSPTEAMFITSNKLLAKERLRAADIRTPAWARIEKAAAREPDFPPPYIVKSVWEHASIGLTGSAVAHDGQSLAEELRRRGSRGGTRTLFVEAYVEGREFNLALLEGPGGLPQVLPPAEIEFRDYPEGKPRIVDYAAKWESGSMGFVQTPRRFDFPAKDQGLLERLRGLCLQCWRLFGLRGYARVDFRVDAGGEPWVLEVNTNPCLSPDAGFLAAAGRAGMSTAEVVRRIVEAARS
jgi:D-alanine-D-alanine ligase